MSDFQIDYILIPLAGCLVGYSLIVTATIIAVGNGWLRKWK